MSDHIYYSILQYKHSIVAGESLNVGILFSFPKIERVVYVSGNLKRIKSLYPDFDIHLPLKINSSINEKLIKLQSTESNLFSKPIIYTARSEDSLKDYIKRNILLEDASSLQFSDPKAAVNIFKDIQKTIDEYCRIFLPESELKKNVHKHNENFILKQFSEQITKKNIVIEHRFIRNKLVETSGVNLNFDFAWQNGITHLIKPISFDLTEEREIQTKSVQYYGYFNLLEEYAKRNQFKFDLLLWKPQDERLHKSYQNAIEIIDKSKAPKEIYTEDRLSEYTDYTAKELHKKDLQ